MGKKKRLLQAHALGQKRPLEGGASQPAKRKKLNREHGEGGDASSSKKKGADRMAVRMSAQQLLADVAPWYEEMKNQKKPMPPQKRQRLAGQILDKLSMRLTMIVEKNEGSRLLQHCIKHGKQEHLRAIYNELDETFRPPKKGEKSSGKLGDHGNSSGLVATWSNQYAHHITIKFMQYGDKELKEQIMNRIFGRVRWMAKQKYSARVLNYVYEHVATRLQQQHLVQEYYGVEYSLLRTDPAPNVQEIIAGFPEEQQAFRRKSIYNEMMSLLKVILRKRLLNFAINHRALMELFTVADAEQRISLAESIIPNIQLLLSTKEGRVLACNAVAYTNAKGRKQVILDSRAELLSMLRGSSSILIVMLLSVTDDTRLLIKHLLKPWMENADTLIMNRHAMRALFAALAPKSKRHFSPDEIKLLQPATYKNENGETVTTSKKPDDVRHAELMAFLSAPLLSFIEKNIDKLICDPHRSKVVQEALLSKHFTAKQAAYRAIAELVKADAELLGTENEDAVQRAAPSKVVDKTSMDVEDDSGSSEDEDEEEDTANDSNQAEEEDEEEGEKEEEEGEEEESGDIDDDVDANQTTGSGRHTETQRKVIRDLFAQPLTLQEDASPRGNVCKCNIGSRVVQRLIVNTDVFAEGAAEEDAFASILFETLGELVLKMAKTDVAAHIVAAFFKAEPTKKPARKMLKKHRKAIKASGANGSQRVLQELE